MVVGLAESFGDEARLRAESGRGETDEARPRVAMREAEEHGPRYDAAVARALHEAAPLERADETRGRRFRQRGQLGELTDRERARRLDHAHEQLGCPVD